MDTIDIRASKADIKRKANALFEKLKPAQKHYVRIEVDRGEMWKGDLFEGLLVHVTHDYFSVYNVNNKRIIGTWLHFIKECNMVIYNEKDTFRKRLIHGISDIPES